MMYIEMGFTFIIYVAQFYLYSYEKNERYIKKINPGFRTNTKPLELLF
jgi:hypothetical protein